MEQRRRLAAVLVAPLGAAATLVPVTAIAAAASTCFPVSSVARSPAALGLDAAQTRNAEAIIAQGRADGVPARGLVVAITTALVEADLTNLASRANPGSLRYPHDGVAAGDHDSVGLFQQRDAWGPLATRMDPARSAHLFFTGGLAGQPGLLDLPGWQSMTIGAAAQAVQRSAFPSRYDQRSPRGAAIVAAAIGAAAATGTAAVPPAVPAPSASAGTGTDLTGARSAIDEALAAIQGAGRALDRSSATIAARDNPLLAQYRKGWDSWERDRQRRAAKGAGRTTTSRTSGRTSGTTSGTASSARPGAAAGRSAGAGAATAPRAADGVRYLGDSLAVGTGAQLAAAGVPATVDAVVGRTTAQGVAALRRTALLPPTLVVDLGTNDDADPAAFTRNVRELLRVAPQSRIYWLTNHRVGRSALTSALKQVAAAESRLHVVDEAAWLHGSPWLLAADGVHLSATGYQERARFLAAAVFGTGTVTSVTAPGVCSPIATGWVLPVDAGSYRISAHFGDAGSRWSSGRHTGLDFAAPTGTPIHAAAAGTVVSAGPDGPYGDLVVLRHAGRLLTYYAHQSAFAAGLSPGTAVAAGQVIGYVGATGNATGPHLHFEVRSAGTPVDPTAWLAGHGAPPG